MNNAGLLFSGLLTVRMAGEIINKEEEVPLLSTRLGVFLFCES